MASSRSQASKGSEKRKRDKTEHDESAHKKRKHGKARKEEERATDTPSRAGDADGVDGHSIINRSGLGSRVNGDIFAVKSVQKWRIADPMGGRMSDIDPIFSAGEK